MPPPTPVDRSNPVSVNPVSVNPVSVNPVSVNPVSVNPVSVNPVSVNPVSADVVVVGAGAMGSATAWRLAQAGRHVVLLERFGPGHDRGSSHGATRIFRLAYPDPRYVELAERAIPLWRELEDASGQVLLEQVGQLDHGRTAVIDEIEANLMAAGRRAERLTPDEATGRWPGMRFDEAVVHSPDGGRCWADRTVAAAWHAARSLGVEVHFETPVEHIETVAGGVIVHAANASWAAPVVVVAAGAWVAPLLRGLVRLPDVLVEDEQPSHFRPLDPDAEWPSFLHHERGPDAGDDRRSFDAYGLFTPGEGVKVGGYGTTAPSDPDRRGGVDPSRTTALVSYVRTWFPGLDPRPTATSSCLFTSTPDGHFVLDRSGPVVVCSPCSGHGFKFVPAIAEQVVALVEGRPQSVAAWRLP